MYLVALTSSYIFHRLQTGHGSYLPEVNSAHWLLWSASITFIYSCIYLFISKEIQEGWDYCLTSPPLPLSSLLTLRGIVVSLPRRRRKSSKCSTPLTSHKESVHTVAHRVLIQICLVTMYDSCAGPPLPHQQARVKRGAHLIISNCAPVPALTFLIIGVTVFFSTGLWFWYRYCRLPRGSRPLTRSFYQDTVSPQRNFKWRLSFLSAENTCILSNFVKRVVSWLLAGLGKSSERLWYPLALLTSHLVRVDAQQMQEGIPAQRTLTPPSMCSYSWDALLAK